MNAITDNSLFFAKTNPNAIIPSKEDEDAGYDVYPCFEEDYMLFKPHETKLVPTGIASAMSSEYYLQAHERGSTGSKGIKVGAGVVDSGFRGSIFIAITNANNCDLCICKEHYIDKMKTYPNTLIYPYEKAIAQLIPHLVPKMEVGELTYEELKAIPSKRGDGVLGSSNK